MYLSHQNQLINPAKDERDPVYGKEVPTKGCFHCGGRVPFLKRCLLPGEETILRAALPGSVIEDAMGHLVPTLAGEQGTAILPGVRLHIPDTAEEPCMPSKPPCTHGAWEK